jgi:hypothetical protein
MTERPISNPPQWRGRSARSGQWWRLTKGDRAVTCDIYTHPLGGDVRFDDHQKSVRR